MLLLPWSHDLKILVSVVRFRPWHHKPQGFQRFSPFSLLAISTSRHVTSRHVTSRHQYVTTLFQQRLVCSGQLNPEQETATSTPPTAPLNENYSHLVLQIHYLCTPRDLYLLGDCGCFLSAWIKSDLLFEYYIRHDYLCRYKFRYIQSEMNWNYSWGVFCQFLNIFAYVGWVVFL